MSYKYDGEARTSKGRICYDRKPHLWNGKDILRIVKMLKDPENDYQAYYLLEAFIVLGNHIKNQYEGFPEGCWGDVKDFCFNRQFEMNDYFAFSGGTFGGAGATRPF